MSWQRHRGLFSVRVLHLHVIFIPMCILNNKRTTIIINWKHMKAHCIAVSYIRETCCLFMVQFFFERMWPELQCLASFEYLFRVYRAKRSCCDSNRKLLHNFSMDCSSISTFHPRNEVLHQTHTRTIVHLSRSSRVSRLSASECLLRSRIYAV